MFADKTSIAKKPGKYKTTQSSIFKLEHSFHILGSFGFVSPLSFNFTKFYQHHVTSNTLDMFAVKEKAVRFLCNDMKYRYLATLFLWILAFVSRCSLQNKSSVWLRLSFTTSGYRWSSFLVLGPSLWPINISLIRGCDSMSLPQCLRIFSVLKFKHFSIMVFRFALSGNLSNSPATHTQGNSRQIAKHFHMTLCQKIFTPTFSSSLTPRFLNRAQSQAWTHKTMYSCRFSWPTSSLYLQYSTKTGEIQFIRVFLKCISFWYLECKRQACQDDVNSVIRMMEVSFWL